MSYLVRKASSSEHASLRGGWARDLQGFHHRWRSVRCACPAVCLLDMAAWPLQASSGSTDRILSGLCRPSGGSRWTALTSTSHIYGIGMHS